MIARRRRCRLRQGRADREGQGTARGRAQEAAQEIKSCSRTCISLQIVPRPRICCIPASPRSPMKRSPDRKARFRCSTPMSEVAGRMAPQVGARCLEKVHGGRGVLLGGVPGVSPASVVILGGGVAGTNAALIASGHGRRRRRAGSQPGSLAPDCGAVQWAGAHRFLHARRGRSSLPPRRSGRRHRSGAGRAWPRN